MFADDVLSDQTFLDEGVSLTLLLPTPQILLFAGIMPDENPSHANSTVNCGVSRQLSA